MAINLQSVAQTATADGNTTAASQLRQLATDFTNASQSGQLPNIQDRAQAVGVAYQARLDRTCERRSRSSIRLRGFRRFRFPVLPHFRFSRTLKGWKYISRPTLKRGSSR